MRKEMGIEEALKHNLELIMENSRDLSLVFEEMGDELSKQRKTKMDEFFIVASVTLNRLQIGLLVGKEQALFDAFMPTCAYLNQQWHKYHKPSLM